MIAPNTITVTAPERSVVMAPFGENHVESVLPVPDSLLLYQPSSFVYYAKNPNPRLFMQGEASVPEALTWGIFNTEQPDAELTPQAFLGMISLYADYDNTREISTNLFRTGFTRKGIGTLAKLGVIHYAFSRDVESITAESAERNYNAHRSLQKAGFVQVGVDSEPRELASGTERMTQWLLHGEEALADAPDSRFKSALIDGHHTYLEAISRLVIRY